MTKEEILKKHGLQIGSFPLKTIICITIETNRYYLGFKSTYSWDSILEAMEEYSQQTVNVHYLMFIAEHSLLRFSPCYKSGGGDKLKVRLAVTCSAPPLA